MIWLISARGARMRERGGRDGFWLASAGDDGAVRVFDPNGHVWASIRLNSSLRHCVINPAKPQVVVAGSRHVYFLDVIG